ncbi:unnamed protein product [Cylicocyclus nassatus]|uniref:Glycosyltransferase family 92 protein n=1 Tax=Cylicocyclus nassatus TaxID=53992 RepID=A0AA36H703_CYLNA|nr:unnamed protein product [Cylicocyclus nassatus]
MTISFIATNAVVLISLLVLIVYIISFDIISTSAVSAVLRSEPCLCNDDAQNGSVCSTSTPIIIISSQLDLSPNISTFTIPQQDWYNELIARGVGKKGGNKMNISLIAAFEYPDQLNVMITSRNRFGDVLYCRYFDENKTEIGDAYKSVVFPEYNIHCLRRSRAAFMSLSDSPKGSYEFPVSITDRTRIEPEHFFSVCVAPIYGNESKWILLAELIEHYKLQGATHFYVYVKYIDEYSRILLDDYIRTGEAEAIILHDRFVRNDDRWQSVQLQDCLLRARGHSRWIAFIDLDERLTLTEIDGTIYDYLRNISDPSFGGIQFRQRWILKNETSPERYLDYEQVENYMPTRRYHNTSHVGPRGHTAKCIVDPQKVLIMNVHNVTKFFKGYRLYPLRPEEGVVRHYRDVVAGNWGRTWLKSVESMGNFTWTDYPQKFSSDLLKNVQHRLHYVYGTG